MTTPIIATPKTLPARSSLARHWDLDPNIVYLNHGGFGATPRVVLDAQQRVRARMEREPTRFFVDDLPALMDESRLTAGAFLSCAWDQLAFVANATTGVATVLHNLNAEPGDEIIVNDHEYPACMNNVRAWARTHGAVVVPVTLPFPLHDASEITRAIQAACTPKTRYCLFSAITSPSGLVLPAQQIVAKLRAKNIEVILDAAHNPGCVVFDVDNIGAAYTTGNFHKWVNAPKSCAFVHVRRDVLDAHEREDGFRPVVLSNNAEQAKPNRSQFLTEFDYVGTTDQSAPLCVPAAIECMATMFADGWDGVRAHNHLLAIEARDCIINTLAPEWEVTAGAPDSMLGPMAAMILPAHPSQKKIIENAGKSAQTDSSRTSHNPVSCTTSWQTRYLDPIWDRLVDEWRIQVPVFQTRAGRTLRISAQVYNTIDQYAYLARALRVELARERDGCV